MIDTTNNEIRLAFLTELIECQFHTVNRSTITTPHLYIPHIVTTFKA